MKMVVIESPYAGEVARNRAYLNACIRWCVLRGMTPYASHKMLTDSLDDNKPDERKLGIDAGYPWYTFADEIIFFTDLGWSNGMKAALAMAAALKKSFRTVNLKDEPDAAADLDNFFSGLPRNIAESAGIAPRNQGNMRERVGGLQPANATLRNQTRRTAGE